MLDSHLHIEDEKILFHSENIYFLNSTSPHDWNLVLNYTKYYHNIYGFAGVHPWFINNISNENWYKNLKDFLIENESFGVGEIGLDGSKKDIDMEKQADFFKKQLDLAIELHRKVSIHCVKAWDIFFKILDSTKMTFDCAILHRFEGSKEILKRLLGYGFYISFFYTLHSREKLKKAFLICPDDKILIESDAGNGPDDLNLIEHYNNTAALKIIGKNEFIRMVLHNGEVFKNNKACWR
jgi:TatD DNase family protein